MHVEDCCWVEIGDIIIDVQVSAWGDEDTTVEELAAAVETVVATAESAGDGE